MKAKLVQFSGGEWIVTEFGPEADLVAAMEIRGFQLKGELNNKTARAELQGQPKFTGVLGPMWDGDGIRYEDQAAYNALSQ